MKTTALLFILFPIVLNAQELVLDLNAENLTLLAIKSSPPDVVEAFLIKKVKTEHTKEYFQALKNKTGIDALVKQVKQDLDKELDAVSNHQAFKLSKAVKYSLQESKPPTIQISSLFPDVVLSVFRGYDTQKGLPDYFNLLMANLEILNSIEIDKSKWIEFQEKQQKTVWAEVILTVSNYQNQQGFQTVIKRIDLFKDKTKKQLLASIVEDRSYNEVVDGWVLSDGFTTRLVGIHAFSVLSYRLQDRISKNLVLNNICEKTDIVDGHQVLMCIHNYTQNSKIIAIFIGGILAQVDLVINSKLADREKQTIIRHLTGGLKTNQTLFKHEPNVWEKYLVDFSYDPSAFGVIKKAGEENTNKYKLVFSMKSQATSKLFEANQ